MENYKHSGFLDCRRILAIAAICGVVAGCSNNIGDRQHLPHYLSGMPMAKASSQRPQVAVSNSVLCDLTHQIAGETLDIVCLLPPGSDPHTYQLTPEARRAIERSQLVLYGGYGLEANFPQAIASHPNQSAVHELAIPRSQTLIAKGKIALDPHVWHDVKQTIAIANTIDRQLQQNFPQHAALYRQNNQKLTAELTQLDRWIRSQIDTIPPANKMVFTTHNALGYYARAYNIPVVALQGVNTAERSHVATTAQLIAQIEQKHVPTIYVELTLDPQPMRTVASAAQVKLATQEIYTDGLGDRNSSGGTYQQMMISNTKEIVTGLGGKYTAFEFPPEKLAAK